MSAAAASPGAAFAVLGATQVALVMAITIIVIPLPAIRRHLSLSQADLALVTQAYGLPFSGLLLLGARLCEVLGHRRAFRIGLVGFALASAGAALAPDLGALLGARFAQGCAAALTAPAAMALLHAVFPRPARRARALAIWGSLAVTGANVGTLLSGIVSTWASWRLAFAVPVALTAAAALAAPRVLPPGPPPRRRRLDAGGALLVMAGLGGIGAGLIESSVLPWTSAPVLAPLLGGALATVAFVTVESRSREPLLPLAFVTPAGRSVALGGILLTAAASAGATFVLSLYFQQVRGFSPFETSVAFLPFALVILSGQVAGRVAGRVGARTVGALGLGLVSAGLLLAGRIGPSTPYAGSLLVAMIAIPLGLGPAFSGTTLAAVERVPERCTALAGGVVNTAMEVGPNVGVAAMVAIAGARSARLAADGHTHAAAAAGGDALALTASGIGFALAAVVAAFALPVTRSR